MLFHAISCRCIYSCCFMPHIPCHIHAYRYSMLFHATRIHANPCIIYFMPFHGSVHTLSCFPQSCQTMQVYIHAFSCHTFMPYVHAIFMPYLFMHNALDGRTTAGLYEAVLYNNFFVLLCVLPGRY